MTDYKDFERELEERVIEISRVAKVVKGGRRFSFRVTMVVGDRQGKVGVGVGKANSVPDAMRKASSKARAHMRDIPLIDGTIAHPVEGKICGARVMLRPATPGTGVIAGGPVRAVLEAAGVKDVLTKSLGTNNPINVVRATMDGLTKLVTLEQVAEERGVPVQALGVTYDG